MGGWTMNMKAACWAAIVMAAWWLIIMGLNLLAQVAPATGTAGSMAGAQQEQATQHHPALATGTALAARVATLEAAQATLSWAVATSAMDLEACTFRVYSLSAQLLMCQQSGAPSHMHARSWLPMTLKPRGR